MRLIKGIVCIAKNVMGYGILFGKNMGKGTDHYENFCSNGMTPFKNIAEARTAGAEIKMIQDIVSVSLVRIKIDVAENNEELCSLKRKKSLIVIRKEVDFEGLVLIGHLPDGHHGRYPLLGAELSDNDMEPLTSFDVAEYVAQEEHRQSACPVSIASFKFKRLGPLEKS